MAHLLQFQSEINHDNRELIQEELQIEIQTCAILNKDIDQKKTELKIEKLAKYTGSEKLDELYVY